MHTYRTATGNTISFDITLHNSRAKMDTKMIYVLGS